MPKTSPCGSEGMTTARPEPIGLPWLDKTYNVLPHPAMDLVEPYENDMPHFVPFYDTNNDDNVPSDPPAHAPFPDDANPGEPNPIVLNHDHPIANVNNEVLPFPRPSHVPARSVSISPDKTDIDPGGLNGMMTYSMTHKNWHHWS